VNDKIPPAIRRQVDGSFDQPHGAETDANEFLQKFIMIAGDACHPGLLAVLAQQLLNEHIVFVGPIPLPAQLPAVNEITHDVKVVAFGLAEKVKELAHLGMSRAQMNVGNPYGAILHGLMADTSGPHHDIAASRAALARRKRIRHGFLTAVTELSQGRNRNGLFAGASATWEAGKSDFLLVLVLVLEMPRF